MNVYDSERMGEALGGNGYVETKNREEADMILLNTCHIREKASEKVYSEIGRLKLTSLDLGNPDVRFIRAMADVQLVDMDTDVQIAAFDESVRKGHVDEGEAARRSVEAIAAQVARKLARALSTLGVAAE